MVGFLLIPVNVVYNSLYAKIEAPSLATSWVPDMIYQVYATYISL